MKIIRNTTDYETRDLRRVICRVHQHMTKLEGKPAPNWKRLRIAVGKSKRGPGSHSGYAYYGGANVGGNDNWAVFLGLPHKYCREHELGYIAYHELMHTYRYGHGQYNDIPERELEMLFPDNDILKHKQPPTPVEKPDKVRQRYDRMLARRKTWQTKLTRAENALSKVEREIAVYERRHGDRLN